VDNATKLFDIAKALGVSRGTVDRALHDRRGVNPLTKARVLQMAKTLGYMPNAAARALSRRRGLRISINLPEHIAPFWDAVRAGIEDEARTLGASGFELQFRTFPRLGSGEEAAFQEALEAEVDGIIMATGHAQELKLPILKASRDKIPVVSVATDAPGTSRLAVVSVDSPASGALAGELLSRFVRGPAKLAVFTGDLAITDHQEKYQAFRDAVASLFPTMQVMEPIQNHEQETEAYDQCRAVLNEHLDLQGIYISTANSAAVIRALENTGRLHRTIVVATDLFPLVVRQLESGGIIATLYQRPRTQGQLALRLLNDFLVEGRCPTYQVRLAPHLVMKSNLQFFMDRTPMESSLGESDGFGKMPRRNRERSKR
jgi:LacI family transcriptional regulator